MPTRIPLLFPDVRHPAVGRADVLPFLKHFHIPAGGGMIEWKRPGLETAVNSIAMLGNSTEQNVEFQVDGGATTYFSSLWLAQSWPVPFKLTIPILVGRDDTLWIRYASGEAAIVALGGVQNHPAPYQKNRVK